DVIDYVMTGHYIAVRPYKNTTAGAGILVVFPEARAEMAAFAFEQPLEILPHLFVKAIAWGDLSLTPEHDVALDLDVNDGRGCLLCNIPESVAMQNLPFRFGRGF